jgi:hypothetical protein
MKKQGHMTPAKTYKSSLTEFKDTEIDEIPDKGLNV